ncbi:MAG: hypothetical protein H6743_03745 [Rickettsiaceae bacterium]|nr:hypothetical protein [Rickettsiaceae bacterium]
MEKELSQLNPGCQPDFNPDKRDYSAEAIMGSNLSEEIDYSKVVNGVVFHPEILIAYIKRVGVDEFKKRKWSIAYAQDIMAEEQGSFLTDSKCQGGMDNCVFEGRAFYGQVLEAVETGDWKDFSPTFKFWEYALEYGAYISSGMKASVKAGFALESEVPSYRYFDTDHGQVLDTDAEFARSTKPLETEEVIERAKIYSSLRYASIASRDIETIAKILILNFGALGGYYTQGMRFDQNGKNIFELDGRPKGGGHCNYFGAVTMEDNKIIIWSKDSYDGWNGRDMTNGWLGHTQETLDAGMYFNWYTLVDKDNFKETTMKAIKADSPHVYLLNHDGSKKMMVLDMATLETLKVPITTVSQEELDAIETAGTMIWAEREILE